MCSLRGAVCIALCAMCSVKFAISCVMWEEYSLMVCAISSQAQNGYGWSLPSEIFVFHTAESSQGGEEDGGEGGNGRRMKRGGG